MERPDHRDGTLRDLAHGHAGLRARTVHGRQPPLRRGQPVGHTRRLGAKRPGLGGAVPNRCGQPTWCLLAAEDINADGRPDVVWSDTTCGAKACFTHGPRHLVGSTASFQDWIDGSTTMASASVQLADVLPEGSGQELRDVRRGGRHDAGRAAARRDQHLGLAGRRARTMLVRQEAAPSDCLYHRVQDGDLAMAARQRRTAYAAAIAAYAAAADDPRLVACWIRENELDELRAYALYRLAVAHAYAGDLDAAGRQWPSWPSAIPPTPTPSWPSCGGSRIVRHAMRSAACAVARTVAERHPDTWQRLADYGFANPAFTIEMICPTP